MRNEYREHSKCQVGYGGIKCPCCSPMNVHPRKSKPLMRRMVRRKSKQKINLSIED